MDPYPQPYPGPAYAPPQPQPRTPSGIRWSLVGIAVILGYFLATALVGLLFARVLDSLQAQPITLDSFLTAVGGLILAAILLVIVGILFLVFYLIGFGFLYAGRNEFGPGHARNLRVSLILLILAIVVSVVQIATVAILSLSTLRFVGQGWDLDGGMFYVSVIANAVLGIAAAALVAAHLVLNVRELAAPKHGVVLYAAAALGTATPGIVGSLTLLQLSRYIDVLSEVVGSQPATFLVPSVDPSVGLPTIVAGVLGLVAFLLFLIAYWGVGVRIRTGVVKPIALPPPPAPAWSTMLPAYPAPQPWAPPQSPPQPPPSP